MSAFGKRDRPLWVESKHAATGTIVAYVGYANVLTQHQIANNTSPTTNQGVVGSNPAGRASFKQKACGDAGFLFLAAPSILLPRAVSA
jgi:hypothetical protein